MNRLANGELQNSGQTADRSMLKKIVEEIQLSTSQAVKELNVSIARQAVTRMNMSPTSQAAKQLNVKKNTITLACRLCEKKFTVLESLEAHMLIYHEDCCTRPFLCAGGEKIDKPATVPYIYSDCNSEIATEKSISCSGGDRKGRPVPCSSDKKTYGSIILCSSDKKTERSVTHSSGDTNTQRSFPWLNGNKKEPSFPCSESNATFLNRQHLGDHKRHSHSSSNLSIIKTGSVEHAIVLTQLFACCECDNKFTTKINFLKHWRSHSNDLVHHDCRSCHKRFATKELLDRHYEWHCYGDNFCETCRLSFPDRQALVDHEQSSACNARQYFCEICSRKCWTDEELVVHKKRSHSDERRFHCEKCDKRFARKYHLQRHYSVHDMVRERFLCRKCGKTFGAKRSLLRHEMNICAVESA